MIVNYLLKGLHRAVSTLPNSVELPLQSSIVAPQNGPRLEPW